MLYQLSYFPISWKRAYYTIIGLRIASEGHRWYNVSSLGRTGRLKKSVRKTNLPCLTECERKKAIAEKETKMNKKLIVAGIAALTLAFGASARPHHFGPGPGFHHHHHHSFWGRGGRNFWPGFVGGVVGGALYDAVTYPRYYGYGYGYSGVVVAPTPTVVAPAPVVVQQPAPVVVQQPAPAVVQQPVAQNVWVEGKYVDQVQANGSVVRVWQPGHYVQSTAVVQ